MSFYLCSRSILPPDNVKDLKRIVCRISASDYMAPNNENIHLSHMAFLNIQALNYTALKSSNKDPSYIISPSLP